MIIPLEKLNALKVNKFEFTKGGMQAVARLNKIKGYPEEDLNWKIIPNVLKLMLDGDLTYYYPEEGDLKKAAESDVEDVAVESEVSAEPTLAATTDEEA